MHQRVQQLPLFAIAEDDGAPSLLRLMVPSSSTMPSPKFSTTCSVDLPHGRQQVVGDFIGVDRVGPEFGEHTPCVGFSRGDVPREPDVQHCAAMIA